MTLEICQIDGTIVKLKNVKVSLLTSSGVLVVTNKSEGKKDRRSRNYILQNLIYYETIPDEAEVSDEEQREIEELKAKMNELQKRPSGPCSTSTLRPADPLPKIFRTSHEKDCYIYIPPTERDWDK